MSARIETIPNPLRSIAIPPELLSDNAGEHIRDSRTLAFITTKQHPALPLSIHNYNHRSFWTTSPLTSYTPEEHQQIIDSKTVPSNQNEGSLALTLASRSLVTERFTGRVISRSFAKFFNYDEQMAYKPTGNEYAHEIQEKVDGSIISLFWYEGPQPLSGPPHSGQWIMASRSSFSSRQTESAWNILNTRFSSLINNTRHPSLDKTKTYVFELVDNRMPIKIHYTMPHDSDLVLLSVIGNDGSETRLGNARLPFRRPMTWKLGQLMEGHNDVVVTISSLKQLSKLPRSNEEGFVITFWRTKDDVYPQRVKVKLESYLKLCKPAGRSGPEAGTSSLSKRGGSNVKFQVLINGPPSPNMLLKIYIAHRLSISSFSGIDVRMASFKQQLLRAVIGLNVSDDYGGEAWLTKISMIWDRIHALFSIQEMTWADTVRMLEGEGYRSWPQGKNSMMPRQNFDKRIKERGLDKSLIPSLKAWFEGRNIQEVVRLVVETAEFPNDLKSTEIIVLRT